MKHFNFDRLIKKYSVEFKVCQHSEGSYVSGKWQEGEESKVDMIGAIMPLSERKIYQSGGAYTSQDRQLFVSEPIENPLSNVVIEYDGRRYHVEEDRDFGQEQWTGVSVYVLKWVSNFD